ncbi:hypothetical protein SFK227_2147 [Shigella flexneri K-227]|uniref:Uncharacterized protein n=1 Tax=Shigella flexneri K-227 TaxID=766147 RepID=F5NVJ5_SHIFL|nr:hypothetical protein SFK227_2147 [Shigella flexneri K-227]
MNITYSVKKCVIKIYIATPEKIIFYAITYIRIYFNGMTT